MKEPENESQDDPTITNGKSGSEIERFSESPELDSRNSVEQFLEGNDDHQDYYSGTPKHDTRSAAHISIFLPSYSTTVSTLGIASQTITLVTAVTVDTYALPWLVLTSSLMGNLISFTGTYRERYTHVKTHYLNTTMQLISAGMSLAGLISSLDTDEASDGSGILILENELRLAAVATAGIGYFIAIGSKEYYRHTSLQTQLTKLLHDVISLQARAKQERNQIEFDNVKELLENVSRLLTDYVNETPDKKAIKEYREQLTSLERRLDKDGGTKLSNCGNALLNCCGTLFSPCSTAWQYLSRQTDYSNIETEVDNLAL